jgi:hypothetical protein
MTATEKLLKEVREEAKKKLLFLPHAVLQMSRLERMISTEEVRNVVENGEVIEDYPEDERGQSCLMLGFGENNRPLHIVCAPKKEYLAIITAYVPSSQDWKNKFRERK